MEPVRIRPAADLVALPSPRHAASVIIEGDRLTVEHMSLVDAGLAAFVAQREDVDRPLVLERALRIGLTAIQDAGVTVDVDVVRREFASLLQRTEAANEHAAAALDAVLRQNFADTDGRLPRTLERFLGDRGQLRAFVNDLFDESRRDSAIGRMRTLLGTYFDGDASRLAQLLDPTRFGSPLHQFRKEVSEGFAALNDRLTRMEAAAAARASERALSSAKGADFEAVVEALLGDICRGSGDLVERTSDGAGDTLRSKKGDFLISLDRRVTRGADVRIVVECKDRGMSLRAIRDELEAARQNRGACVAVVCFTPAHAPAGIYPFDVRGSDVYCVLDPQDPERAVLEAAIRLARLVALATLRDDEADVDVAALSAVLDGIRGQLDAVRGLKSQLTSIGNASLDVSRGLDRLREGVLARVGEAELELVPQSARDRDPSS